MENEVLNSDNLRLRLIDLEYKGLKNEDLKWKSEGFILKKLATN